MVKFVIPEREESTTVTTQISFTATIEQKKWLRDTAKNNGISESRILRAMVEQMMEG